MTYRTTWENFRVVRRQIRKEGGKPRLAFIEVSIGEARQGMENSLELASLNNFSRP